MLEVLGVRRSCLDLSVFSPGSTSAIVTSVRLGAAGTTRKVSFSCRLSAQVYKSEARDIYINSNTRIPSINLITHPCLFTRSGRLLQAVPSAQACRRTTSSQLASPSFSSASSSPVSLDSIDPCPRSPSSAFQHLLHLDSEQSTPSVELECTFEGL
jgi:hypothetical protein